MRFFFVKKTPWPKPNPMTDPWDAYEYIEYIYIYLYTYVLIYLYNLYTCTMKIN